MKPEKATRVLQAIYRQTAAGALGWQSVPFESDAFSVDLPRERLQISRTYDDESTYYSLKLFDNDGREIDEIVSSALPDMYRTFWEIFAEARDIALDVNTLVDNLLSDLGEDPESNRGTSDDEIPF